MDNSNFQDNQRLKEIAADGDELMTDEEYLNVLKNMSNEEAVAIMAEELLIESGYPEEDPDVRAEMRMDLAEQISAKINNAINEALPEEQVAKLDQMIKRDEATPDKVAELINGSGIDVQRITRETVEKFREDYLNGAPENE